MRFVVVLALLLAAVFVSAQTERYLVGAHYYPWYNKLSWERIDAQPALGHYVSADRRVIAQQLRWASDYGIDFFGVEWRGPEIGSDKILADQFINSPELKRMYFCIAYDTLTRFAHIQPPPYNFSDPQLSSRFLNDLDYISKKYFGHPRYLKFNGRPVLWLYLGRALDGDWKGVLEQARERVRANGYDLYLDADLLYPERTDRSRIKYFDAASAYILNQRQLFLRNGVRFTGDVLPIARYTFQDWAKHVPREKNKYTKLPVAFHPVITPQFDKTGDPGALRYTLRSPEEFREMAELAKQAATYDEAAQARVVWITSWNEWFEHTAIEPTVSGPDPAKNYGFQLLQAIRDVFSSQGSRISASSH